MPKEQLLYTLNDLDEFLITCKINDEEIGTATVPINDVELYYDTTGNLVAKISSENHNFYANNDLPTSFSFIKQSFSHQENCTCYFISDWAYAPSSDNLDVVFEVTLTDKAGLSTTKSATSSTTKLSPPILTYHDNKTILPNDSNSPHIIKVESGDTDLPIIISFADKDEAGYSVDNAGITINTKISTKNISGETDSNNIEINPGFNTLEVTIKKEDYFDCTTNYHIYLYTNTLYIAKSGSDNAQAAGATKDVPLATKAKIESLLKSFNDSNCDYTITIVNDFFPYDKDLDFSGINLVAKSLCITATDQTKTAIEPAAAQGELKTLIGNTNCPLTIEGCKISADTRTCKSPLVLMSSKDLTIQNSEFSYKYRANTLTSIIEFDASSCNKDITLTITGSKFTSNADENKNAINLKNISNSDKSKFSANITDTKFDTEDVALISFTNAISCDGNVELTMNKVDISKCTGTALVLNNATCKIYGGSFKNNYYSETSSYEDDNGKITQDFFGGAIRAINSELEILPYNDTEETIISTNSIDIITGSQSNLNAYGGAIALLNNSKATITAIMTSNKINLTINSEINQSNLRGGALYIDKTSRCDLKLVKQDNSRCSINGNYVSVNSNTYDANTVEASAFGGAIFNEGTLKIEGGDFTGNRVKGTLKNSTPFYGQGIIYNTGKLTITGGSYFSGGGKGDPTNTSLIYATTDNNVQPGNFGLHIDGATFTINDAGNSLGGAIYFAPNNSSIYEDKNKYQFEISGNTTFEECSALAGGAIYVNVLAAPINNSKKLRLKLDPSSGTITFKKNEATGEFNILHMESCGGAIYMGEHTQLYCSIAENSDRIVFQGNISEDMGGALFFSGASFSSSEDPTTIVNKKLYFQKNNALVGGGAIGAIFSDIDIAHAKFVDNECLADDGNSTDILDWNDNFVKFSGMVKIVDSEFIFPSHKAKPGINYYLISLSVSDENSSIRAGFQRNTFSYRKNDKTEIVIPFWFYNMPAKLCFDENEIVFKDIIIDYPDISDGETFFKSAFGGGRDMICPIRQQDNLKTLKGAQLF